MGLASGKERSKSGCIALTLTGHEMFIDCTSMNFLSQIYKEKLMKNKTTNISQKKVSVLGKKERKRETN